MIVGDVIVRGAGGGKPIKEWRENGLVTAATGWGEIGSARIADVFVTHDSNGSILSMKTSRGHTLRCSPEQLCFCKFDPMSRLYYLYLMERSTMGFRVGMSQDLLRDVFALQSTKLVENDASEIVDRIWIIEGTESLPKAVFLARYASCKYGLPDVPFTGQHATAELPDELLRELFNRIDTPSRAHQLLLDSLMFEEYPHITVKLNKNAPTASNAVQFIVFGAAEKAGNCPGYAHLIRIDSAIELNRGEHKAFKRRMNNRGLWHLEVAREEFEEAQLFVKTLAALDNLEIIKKIQLTKKAPFYILPASHVKLGMTVSVAGGRSIEEDTVTSITVESWDNPLYDLKTEGIHNYIAGDWVVMSYSGQISTAPSLKRDVV
ncbi:MAG: hypothetical protein HQM09_01580 [Candidatus Riflebacteria bacterium]|nr:hypothetical protein [Candidatus Riflebacteria bacterium]